MVYCMQKPDVPQKQLYMNIEYIVHYVKCSDTAQFEINSVERNFTIHGDVETLPIAYNL